MQRVREAVYALGFARAAKSSPSQIFPGELVPARNSPPSCTSTAVWRSTEDGYRRVEVGAALKEQCECRTPEGAWIVHGFPVFVASTPLLRYGFGLKKVNDVMERVIKNFTRLYDIIEDPDGHGGPFRDLAEVLVRVGLYDVTQQTLGQFLRAHDVPERLVDEFVTGCTRVNYGQSPWRMNAFAGTVALKGSGKELYSVQEGNQLLVWGSCGTGRGQ